MIAVTWKNLVIDLGGGVKADCEFDVDDHGRIVEVRVGNTWFDGVLMWVNADEEAPVNAECMVRDILERRTEIEEQLNGVD